MQFSRWGNSLVIRLGSALFVALGLASHDRRREGALETLRALRRPFPEGFRFDRNEANER
jgi:antitoxin MazE